MKITITTDGDDVRVEYDPPISTVHQQSDVVTALYTAADNLMPIDQYRAFIAAFGEEPYEVVSETYAHEETSA